MPNLTQVLNKQPQEGTMSKPHNPFITQPRQMPLSVRLRTKLIDLLLGKDLGIVRGAKIVDKQLTATEGIKYLDVTGIYMEGIGILATGGLHVNASRVVVKGPSKGLEYRWKDANA